MKYKYTGSVIQMQADTVTPVGLYLRLRDLFPKTFLLESTDHGSAENSRSFIALEPLTEFIAQSGEPDLLQRLRNYRDSHERINAISLPVDGIFGYTSYEAVASFDPSLKFSKNESAGIPCMQYAFYRFVIGIDHFRDEMFIVENIPEGESARIGELRALLENRSINEFDFRISSAITSGMSDEEFMDMTTKGKEECRRGNVFQVVLSRSFRASYSGDEFQVYRALRNVNPSPYLFYYDGGDFRIFGSSPEAQLTVKDRKAVILPIAGTFKRTGSDARDQERAQALLHDPKEKAEHMMLVDLARNDLSTCCKEVKVEELATIRYYSHVIHMESRVSGILQPGKDPLELFATSFPAGTLSGAPKHKAMQIIEQLEPEARGYYGGALGYFGFDGEVNHCIIIRTFLAKDKILSFRAGAGVVIASEESGELEEVHNKLAALRLALTKADAQSSSPVPRTSSLVPRTSQSSPS